MSSFSEIPRCAALSLRGLEISCKSAAWERNEFSHLNSPETRRLEIVFLPREADVVLATNLVAT